MMSFMDCLWGVFGDVVGVVACFVFVAGVSKMISDEPARSSHYRVSHVLFLEGLAGPSHERVFQSSMNCFWMGLRGPGGFQGPSRGLEAKVNGFAVVVAVVVVGAVVVGFDLRGLLLFCL